jgi:hypothetical protein
LGEGGGSAAVAEWAVAQGLVDGEALNDWEARFSVSLVESRAQARAVVRFVEASPVDLQANTPVV